MNNDSSNPHHLNSSQSLTCEKLKNSKNSASNLSTSTMQHSYQSKHKTLMTIYPPKTKILLSDEFHLLIQEKNISLSSMDYLLTQPDFPITSTNKHKDYFHDSDLSPGFNSSEEN